ncbi:unnamed protein product [Ilex paraguariensis]|uniref:EF-hand domain-containing protein n=1 Tax=Ilex paraguariensis TaxID=185542 RepID=A0ABC8UQA2_9AQUA
MRKLAKTAFYIFLLSALTFKVTGRFLQHSSPELVSDSDHVQDEEEPSFLVLKGIDLSSEDDRCKQMYGFLPCPTSLWGHLFLIVVYEYLLFQGESHVISGGEQIFKILGPGFFGASIFRILGALPESLILLATGLVEDKEGDQESVQTALGLLAGSTILHLTLLWGTCVTVGSKADPPTPSSRPLNHGQNHFKKFSLLLAGSSLKTDTETRKSARIMLLSVIPFSVMQIPIVFTLSPLGKRIVILIALIVCVVFVLSYFFYQIFDPQIQKRELEYVKQQRIIVMDLLKHVQTESMHRFHTDDGEPDFDAIKRLFESLDINGDNNLSPAELKELVVNIKFRSIPWDVDVAVAQIMEELDANGDQMINKEEFIKGWTKLLKMKKNQAPTSTESTEDEYQQREPEQGDMLEENSKIARYPWELTKATMLLVVGVVMLGFLGEPLIKSVQNFSTSANVPSFFISFVLVPLASNARVAISAISMARRQKPRTTSLTFSEVCFCLS